MKKINVAIIGVGSFAKALVEGVSFYAAHPKERTGLMNPTIGGYRVSDINFVAAFDVDSRKVGKPLHEAIRAKPNVTRDIFAARKTDALVYRGPTLDGVHEAMRGSFIRESSEPIANIADVLRAHKTNVVLNLLPTGGSAATYAYAKAALDAHCSFVNCIPTPLATLPNWKARFASKGLALLGDDIKSQIGATMLNRMLLECLKMRGVRINKSEQENRGGNADHLNLLYRAAHKERSKRGALECFLDKEDAKPSVTFRYTGKPSGRKRVTITIEGEIFGCTPISLTAVIEDEISINGAGVAIDAIRAAHMLERTGRAKNAWNVCPFLFKSPLRPLSDSVAHEAFQKETVGTRKSRAARK